MIYSKHSSKQQALLHPIFEFSLICTKYDKYFIFWDFLALLTSNDVTKQCLKSRLCSVRVSCVKFPMKTKIPSEVLPHRSFLQCIFVEKMPRYIVIVYSQSFPKEICLRLVTFVILEILQNWFMCTSYCAVIITKNLFIRIHSLAPKFLLMYRSTDKKKQI